MRSEKLGAGEASDWAVSQGDTGRLSVRITPGPLFLQERPEEPLEKPDCRHHCKALRQGQGKGNASCNQIVTGGSVGIVAQGNRRKVEKQEAEQGAENEVEEIPEPLLFHYQGGHQEEYNRCQVPEQGGKPAGHFLASR